MAKAAKNRAKTQTRTARHGSASTRAVRRETRPWARKSRREAGTLESWLGLATTLVSSAVGAAIVAEVLVATAEVLRRHRADIGEADEQRLNIGTGGLTTEPMSEVLVRSAAGALAEVASDAVRRMRQEPSSRDDEGARRE